MKKMFIYSFLFILATFVYADSEYMKNWTKEDIAKFNKMSQVEKDLVIETLEISEEGKKIRAELEKERKLGKTLDKLNNMLDVKK